MSAEGCIVFGCVGSEFPLCDRHAWIDLDTSEGRQALSDVNDERVAWFRLNDVLGVLVDVVQDVLHVSQEPSGIRRAIEGCLPEVFGVGISTPTPKPTRATPVHERLHRLAERDGWWCKYCGQPVTCSCDIGPGGDAATAVGDHVLPQSRGGPDTDDNLVLSCWSCNSSKGDRTPSEWGR